MDPQRGGRAGGGAGRDGRGARRGGGRGRGREQPVEPIPEPVPEPDDIQLPPLPAARHRWYDFPATIPATIRARNKVYLIGYRK